MEIYDAWLQFEKTGSIKKYLEYKNLCREKEKSAYNNRGVNNERDKDRGK